jgi:hypothetical protein
MDWRATWPTSGARPHHREGVSQRRTAAKSRPHCFISHTLKLFHHVTFKHQCTTATIATICEPRDHHYPHRAHRVLSLDAQGCLEEAKSALPHEETLSRAISGMAADTD